MHDGSDFTRLEKKNSFVCLRRSSQFFLDCRRDSSLWHIDLPTGTLSTSKSSIYFHVMGGYICCWVVTLVKTLLFPSSVLQRSGDIYKQVMVYYRYHYREAVVVSALQVLKYPLTMPGPASVATPPARHLPPSTYYVPSSLHAWSETMSDGRNSKLGGTFSTTSNTPMHSPLPNRPHHSPKIKLKYVYK